VAADVMLKHEIGVLSATTAFGKTVVAAWLIAQRRINTLVLVHRRQLLDQWVERLATFLELPQNRSDELVAAETSRPACSTWRSFKVLSVRVW
jgi:superfamily II DNA or RNA helicase